MDMIARGVKGSTTDSGSRARLKAGAGRWRVRIPPGLPLLEATMSIERILDWHYPVALLLVILVLFLSYNRIVKLEERVRVLQGDVFVLQTLHESRALEGSAEREKR